MCGRYTITPKSQKRHEGLLNTEFPEVAPRYNIAPSQDSSVIRLTSRKPELVEIKWRLVPS